MCSLFVCSDTCAKKSLDPPGNLLSPEVSQGEVIIDDYAYIYNIAIDIGKTNDQHKYRGLM